MTEKPVIPSPAPASTTSAGVSILIFGFGAAAGLLMAFSGLGFMEDRSALIATVFLIALCVVALISLALVLLSRPWPALPKARLIAIRAGPRRRRAIWCSWCWRAIRG